MKYNESYRDFADVTFYTGQTHLNFKREPLKFVVRFHFFFYLNTKVFVYEL